MLTEKCKCFKPIQSTMISLLWFYINITALVCRFYYVTASTLPITSPCLDGKFCLGEYDYCLDHHIIVGNSMALLFIEDNDELMNISRHLKIQNVTEDVITGGFKMFAKNPMSWKFSHIKGKVMNTSWLPVENELLGNESRKSYIAALSYASEFTRLKFIPLANLTGEVTGLLKFPTNDCLSSRTSTSSDSSSTDPQAAATSEATESQRSKTQTNEGVVRTSASTETSRIPTQLSTEVTESQLNYTDKVKLRPCHVNVSSPTKNSVCGHEWNDDLREMIKINLTVGAIANAALQFLNETKELYPSDIVLMNNFLRELLPKWKSEVKNLASEKPSLLEPELKSFPKHLSSIFSNILRPQRFSAWLKLEKRTKWAIATTMGDLMEKSGLFISTFLKNSTFEAKSNYIYTRVESRPAIYFKKRHLYFPNDTNMFAQVILPIKNNTHSKDQVNAVGILYENLHQYLDLMNPDVNINSKIFSFSIDEKRSSLNVSADRVILVFRHRQLYSKNVKCSYWAFDYKDINGSWKQDGCFVLNSNVTHTTCECNHLTNFAVLMDVQGRIQKKQPYFLDYLTIICCSSSIICLTLSFVIFHSFRSLQNPRTTITKNLCLPLGFAHLLLITGMNSTENKIGCGIIAGLLHYSFLCAFVWMALEGLHLYILVVRVFQNQGNYMYRYYLAGYGLPLVVVAVSASGFYYGYGTKEYCWLDPSTNTIWFFCGPIALIILVNIVFLSLALKSAAVIQLSTEGRKLDKIKKGIRGGFSLSFILGITWVFGYFIVIDGYEVCTYLFVILNASQGVFIFYFHCISGENVRLAMSRVMKRHSHRWMNWVSQSDNLPESQRTTPGSHYLGPNTSSARKRSDIFTSATQFRVSRGLPKIEIRAFIY